MAGDLQIFLLERHLQTRRHPDLFAHQIDAENRLGHRMFDLQAGVHFDKEEFAVLIQIFDGAGTDVVDLGNGIGADLADFFAQSRGDHRAGGFLEHLLVTALQGTIALAQMHGTALAIAKNLNLDMAGV